MFALKLKGKRNCNHNIQNLTTVSNSNVPLWVVMDKIGTTGEGLLVNETAIRHTLPLMVAFLRLRHISVALMCCRVSLANRKCNFSSRGDADAQAADPKRLLSSSICFNMAGHVHKNLLYICIKQNHKQSCEKELAPSLSSRLIHTPRHFKNKNASGLYLVLKLGKYNLK